MDTKKTVFDLPSNYLMTSKQAARFLNIKIQSLYNMVHQGKILPRKLGDSTKGRLRFVKSDLEKVLGY